MPSFRNKLSDEERWEVVLYLRTLPQNPDSNRSR
jgi:mono/diheme cytochrome c family protein